VRPRSFPILLSLLLASAVTVAEEPTLPVFKDVTKEAGIQAKHSYGDFKLSNIVEGTGAGAMFFDYDGDGWLDIYLVNGCWRKDVNDNRGRKLRGKLSNRLYHNNRNGTFTDVTRRPAWATGATAPAARRPTSTPTATWTSTC